ncbi:TPA: hypothetical protein PD879_002522 [Staphylococcus aureus]|uniref:hypothetical protein n=1 Tax=Staphylococcus aureus TaxID=1280 RepID=UPI0028BC6980|nr:hypothetical protein [Staphylococcus aureus]HDE9869399.1 hypothetical protein [Staphylococcus aureus]HDF1766903.1 hypothetical protein [Staphylococcus aureus]HDG2601114.1 hypothetical protein [Staphylococcus aureus]HDH1976605.1 hypothetical protein [Staphylococcus aureus]
MEDTLLLVVYNRLPLEDEIEDGIDENERMIDSTILLDEEKYNDFIESDVAVQYDFKVTAIHNITEQGYIVGS